MEIVDSMKKVKLYGQIRMRAQVQYEWRILYFISKTYLLFYVNKRTINGTNNHGQSWSLLYFGTYRTRILCKYTGTKTPLGAPNQKELTD